MSQHRDTSTAAQYEAWYATPRGAVALERERALIAHLTSDWPRRGQRLIEIGCGSGMFLELFWQSGFDVAGLDPAPDMLCAARRRMGKHADLYQGHAGRLPFDDNEFDYAALVTSLEFVDDPTEAVREAVRVARKGLLVAFLNRRSWYYLSSGPKWPWSRKLDMPHGGRWYSWPQVWEMCLESSGLKPFKARSVLPGPPCTWSAKPPWRQLNALFYPPGLGAFSAACFDLYADKPLTPVMAWKTGVNPS